MNKLRTAASVLFLCYVVILLILSIPRPDRPANRTLLNELWKGSNKGYIPLGIQAKIFKPYIKNEKVVSLITDDESEKSRVLHKSVQGYLCPLVINSEAQEKFALVLTSNAQAAEKKLKDNGYTWIHKLTDSVGVAKKA